PVGGPPPPPRPGLGLRRPRRGGGQRPRARLRLSRDPARGPGSAVRRQDPGELASDPLSAEPLPGRLVRLPAAPRRRQRQLADGWVEGEAEVRHLPPPGAARRPRLAERRPMELRPCPRLA